jgi:hypothetical protein
MGKIVLAAHCWDLCLRLISILLTRTLDYIELKTSSSKRTETRLSKFHLRVSGSKSGAFKYLLETQVLSSPVNSHFKPPSHFHQTLNPYIPRHPPLAIQMSRSKFKKSSQEGRKPKTTEEWSKHLRNKVCRHCDGVFSICLVLAMMFAGESITGSAVTQSRDNEDPGEGSSGQSGRKSDFEKSSKQDQSGFSCVSEFSFTTNPFCDSPGPPQPRAHFCHLPS